MSRPTAEALRRRDLRQRGARHRGAQVDNSGGQLWKSMRTRPLDFNQDYTPQAICCGTCQRPIEDANLEDQAGRPACSEACAAGPHLEPEADLGEPGDRLRAPKARRSRAPKEERGHLIAMTTRERRMLDVLRAVPEPFTLVEDQP